MHDRQDDDLVIGRAKVDSVRKPTDEGSPGVAPHAGIGQRVLLDCCDRGLDRRGEDGAQADSLCFIPISRIE
jgi:hypothetical protein